MNQGKSELQVKSQSRILTFDIFILLTGCAKDAPQIIGVKGSVVEEVATQRRLRELRNFPTLPRAPTASD